MPKPSTIRVPFSSLSYSPDVARYRGSNGRFLAPSTVRKIIVDDLDATKERMVALSLKAQSGEISVEEWRAEYAKEVKALHLGKLAEAKGGIHNLTQADYGRAGQILRTQYGYLDKRAQIAANDPQYLASDRFLRDTAMYADAGLETYETTRLVEERNAGFQYEINVLDDEAVHCKPKNGKESCQQQTTKGAVETGTLIMIGRRVCTVKCRCEIRRFKTKEAAEAALAATKAIRQLVPMEMYS